MKFLKFLPVLVAFSIFLSGCTMPSLVKKNAGLQIGISGDEKAEVFLNGMNVGQTPYKADDLKPGSYTLKLVPQGKEKIAYETHITLNSGLFTVVTWSFGATAEESGGEIFELSKISNSKKGELSVITNPDNIVVRVDGQSKGFSPYILDDLSEGQHTLTMTAPGYVERTSSPKITKGYRITVTAKLARESSTTATQQTEESSSVPEPSPKVSPKPSASPVVKATPTPKPATSSASTKPSATPDLPYVEIKQTGTGWLRVRASADSSSEELAKLDVGAKVPYLNETVSGWHKVEYESGKEGWVSGQWAVVHKE